MVNADRVKGCLVGGAVGDAIGLPAEFASAKEIAADLEAYDFMRVWPDTYIDSKRPGEAYEAGETSDDTDQDLLLLETCLEAAERDAELVDCTAFAAKLLAWKAGGAKGMGGLTRAVLEHEHFATDPARAAFQVWLDGGARSAPNGAVMRAAYGGLVRPGLVAYDSALRLGGPTLVGINAMRCAWTTHADPACKDSACAVADAVGQLVSAERGFSFDDRVQVAVDHAKAHLGPINHELLDLRDVTLADLQLDEGLDESRGTGKRAPIGHTYKTLRAGFWALAQVSRGRGFHEVLKEVVLAGGDADTNGCVAGALMGAALGASRIPPHLIEGLKKREVLNTMFERVMNVNNAKGA